LTHGANCGVRQVLAEVTQSAQAAEVVKAAVQKVKDKAQAIVVSIEKEKIIAEGKLEAARPALEEAEAALQVRRERCSSDDAAEAPNRTELSPSHPAWPVRFGFGSA